MVVLKPIIHYINIQLQAMKTNLTLRFTLLISIFLISHSINSLSAQCDSDLNLNSQAAVDSYSGCTIINANLFITGTDINNLDALKDLQQIDGNLFIQDNPLLENISGLSNLQSISGSLYIKENDLLENVNGLSKLSNIAALLWIENNDKLLYIDGLSDQLDLTGAVVIKDNPSLQYIDNLSNIKSANIDIRNNASMYRINGFQSLTSVNSSISILSNSALRDINGFNALINIGLNFIIQNNDSLLHFNGFSNLAAINGFAAIRVNADLENLNGLANLTTVGDYLNIEFNNSMTDIEGLSNLASADTLHLVKNTSLKSCCVLETINTDEFLGVINISENAEGCNSLEEITATCDDTLMSIINELFILENVYPTPTTSTLNIEFSSLKNGLVNIELLDLSGKKMLSKFHNTISGNQKISIDVESLPNGIYFLKASSKDGVLIARKIMKE